MSKIHGDTIGRQVGLLFDPAGAALLTDAQLLERIAHRGDHASVAPAFEALVVRHGPMVRATCRRLIGDPHEADDAFQAVFLILARRARAVWVRDSLAGWLHGVARRVSARSRLRSARHTPRDPSNLAELAAPEPPASEPDDATAIHEEVARLPRKYREAVVLCYFEGRTHDQAAHALRCPVGTVRSRLARARDRLRDRLRHRGLAPSIALLDGLPDGRLMPIPLEELPPSLIQTTARVAARYASDGATATGACPAAASLARGVLRAMMFAKLSAIAGLALTALVATTAGLALAAGPASAQNRAEARPDPFASRSTDPTAPPVDPNLTARQDPPPSPPAPSDPFAGPSDNLALPSSDPYAAPILEVRFTQAERKLKRLKSLHERAIISIEEVMVASDELGLLLAQAEARRDDLRDLVERLKVRVDAAEAAVEVARVRHEISTAMAREGGFEPNAMTSNRREAMISAATLKVEEAQLREAKVFLAQSERRLSQVEDFLSRHGESASRLIEPAGTPNISAPSPSRQ